MPKTTKEKVKEKKTSTKETVEKKATSKAKVAPAKKATKTATAKKSTTAKNASKSSKKTATTKKAPAKKVETPKKTTEKKTTTKKAEAKKETTKKVAEKPKKVTKKVETKKTETKKSPAKKATVKKVATKKTEKKPVEKTVVKKVAPKKEEIKKDEKINEKSVIEKIKAFIAKIVAMQEEARLEEEYQEEKDTEKVKTKNKKEKAIDAKPSYILEYYDLPYRYNETVVKILAQTPKRLFVYWDISDKDRQKYLMAFGERFFEETYPVLLVHNEDMNYTFEVPINDFANSWYLDINDSKANYTIQLGRKFRNKPTQVNIVASTETESVELYNDYVPIITSNMLEVPNDHILFEKVQSKVLYRNVKTGAESTVDIDNLEFAKRMGHIYSIYDVYKEIYKNELDDRTLTDLLNPSSMSSSTFK